MITFPFEEIARGLSHNVQIFVQINVQESFRRMGNDLTANDNDYLYNTLKNICKCILKYPTIEVNFVDKSYIKHLGLSLSLHNLYAFKRKRQL